MTFTITKADFATLYGRRDALYFHLDAGLTATTIDVDGRGNAFASYDPFGRLIGIEFLGPCKVTPKRNIGVVTVSRDERRQSKNGRKHAKAIA
jgi:uncharacterized protein YuzE